MNSNKKIAINTIILFGRLCIVSIITLVLARVVLDALGASDYGLYNVVAGVVTFINVINMSMTSTTYRFLAYEIGKGENSSPNKIFNTSMMIHAVFAIFILIVGIFAGEWYVNNYLNVDAKKIPDAIFVLHTSVVTASLSTFLVPYQGLLIANEKFSITTAIDVLVNIVKLIIILLLIYSEGNRLRLYSLIMMFCTLIGALLFALICIKDYRRIIKLRLYKDWRLCKEMASYAFWTLFGAVSSIGKSQGSAIIVNFFCGTITNAAYAIATQVNSFVSLLARNLGQAATPQITKSFSGGDSNRSIQLTCYISKYDFFLMALVAFPILLEIDFLLDLWLKEIPEGSATFCRLVILAALLDSLGGGIPSLVNATGHIRNYQVITHTFIVMALPIAVIFYKFGGDMYTITKVYCVIIFLSAFLKLYLLKKIFKFDVRLFFNISYARIAIVSVPLLLYYILYTINDYFLINHFVGIVISEVFLIAVIYILGLEQREKDIIIKQVKRIKIRYNHGIQNSSF